MDTELPSTRPPSCTCRRRPRYVGSGVLASLWRHEPCLRPPCVRPSRHGDVRLRLPGTHHLARRRWPASATRWPTTCAGPRRRLTVPGWRLVDRPAAFGVRWRPCRRASVPVRRRSRHCLVRCPSPTRRDRARPSAAPVRWGLGDAASGWLLAQVGGFIAIVIVASPSRRRRRRVDDLSLGWIAVAQLGLWAGLLGVPWLAARLKGNGSSRLRPPVRWGWAPDRPRRRPGRRRSSSSRCSTCPSSGCST